MNHLANSTLAGYSFLLLKRLAVMAVLLLVFVGAPRQSLRAQTTPAPGRLPSAEKIIDSYLKTIGGKKRVAALHDATYEWDIPLKPPPMGIAKTQIKFPVSARAELTFGNG